MNSGIYVGVAVAAEQGVLGVSLRDCRDRSVVGISKAGKEVVQRAQSGVMRDEDYTKNTFSINNMGMFEVDGFSAIIYSSQVAVIAVGTVRKHLAMRDDQITMTR
ncbi:MAG: 2-oxo acid dehydrogenase subunit E2 [Dehalococcoidia bacterium]|jgi:pyruvate dehydrogenase E2 component (dihydrolipoamide acetyltransferase)|nr:2-oxo acid dehydrogenase subunit E2 [Dehalococcoidia bacterium]